ncbi:unnamed protein product [Urochloa humidicola]
MSCRNCCPKADINNSSLLLPFFPMDVWSGVSGASLGCLVLLGGAWSCCILLFTSCNTIATVDPISLLGSIVIFSSSLTVFRCHEL